MTEAINFEDHKLDFKFGFARNAIPVALDPSIGRFKISRIHLTFNPNGGWNKVQEEVAIREIDF